VAATSEWDGRNDVEPYYTNITQYASAHPLPLAYLDSSILIAKSGTSYQLTATGTKVMQAYAAVANRPGPVAITLVTNATAKVP
jgi:hypothetical protein